MKWRVLKGLCMLLIVLSCKHTEIIEKSQGYEISAAFEGQKKSTLVKRDIAYSPQWQNSIDFEGTTYVPLTTDKRISSFTSDNIKYSLDGNIWLKGKRNSNEWKFSIVTVLPNDVDNNKESGILLSEDWKTGKLSYKGYIGDKLFSPKNYVLKMKSRADINLKAVGSVQCKMLLREVCAGSGSDERCNRWFVRVCEDAEEDGNIETPNDEAGDGGGSPGGGNSGDTNTPPIIPPKKNAVETFNSEIDDTNLLDCMKGVLGALKTLPGNTVADIIKKFSGELPGYRLSFEQKFIGGDAGLGQTAWVDNVIKNGYVTINFNSNRDVIQNATDVAVAATMLHESVHAYLYAYYKDDPTSATADYPELFRKFIVKKSGINSNTTQHNVMAKIFIDDIAASLIEYGKVEGHNMDDSFYKDLAWKGLTETDAFKSLNDIDKKRIINTIYAEQYGVERESTKRKGNKLGC